MSAARTVEFFGYYLIPTGLLVAASPNLLLVPLGLGPATEPWARVLGLLVAPLGACYVTMARAGITKFLWFTVGARIWIFVTFTILVLAALAPPMLVLFGAVDLLGAVWTWLALRREV